MNEINDIASPQDIQTDIDHLKSSAAKLDRDINRMSDLSVKTVDVLFKLLRETELYKRSQEIIKNLPVSNVPHEWSSTFHKYCTPARSQRKIVEVPVVKQADWYGPDTKIKLTVGKKYGVIHPYGHSSTEIVAHNTYALVHDDQIQMITNSKKLEAGMFLANIRASLDAAYRVFDDGYVIQPSCEVNSKLFAIKYYGRLRDGVEVPVLEHSNKALRKVDMSNVKCIITPLNGYHIWNGKSRTKLRQSGSTTDRWNKPCALRFTLLSDKGYYLSEILLDENGIHSIFNDDDHVFPLKDITMTAEEYYRMTISEDPLYSKDALLYETNIITYFWLDIFRNLGIQKDVIKFLETYSVAGKALRFAQQQYAALLFLTNDW